VYLDKIASPKEQEILDFINKSNVSEIKKQLQLTDVQIKAVSDHIQSHGPLGKIRELLRIRGVGEKAHFAIRS